MGVISPFEYLEQLKERLLTAPLVVACEVREERATVMAAYLRARLTLTNNSLLEISEYAKQQDDDTLEVLTYSYHWADAQGTLLCRWDNAPHFPGLPNFPHHQHHGPDNVVTPSEPMTLPQVLDEIAKRLSTSV